MIVNMVIFAILSVPEIIRQYRKENRVNSYVSAILPKTLGDCSTLVVFLSLQLSAFSEAPRQDQGGLAARCLDVWSSVWAFDWGVQEKVELFWTLIV